jgi:DNA helicase HerA-like ATPase
MWLLADLYHDLPEVGDVDKPKLVFFFDEAHLLFADASKAFLDSIAQTVRLIRSKGVGVFFVTQTPKDVPDDVLAQLGSRVQHQLRAHTPNDAKALKATVSTFPNSTYDLGEVLTQLGIGEAIVTVMNERGAPTPVAWTRLRAPQSLMAPAPAEQLAAAVSGSPNNAKYTEVVDRESAYEKLAAKVQAGAEQAEAEAQGKPAPSAPAEPRARAKKEEKSMVEQVVGSSAFKQFARSAGREIIRGLFGAARRRR